MNIVDVRQLLVQHANGADPLRITRLAALEPRREPYLALLCQPHGTIHASAERIGNSDSNGVLPMYRGFLQDAVNSQAQLAVTPEYSVPWTLVRDIVDGTVRPSQGALWALGCESITPDDLDALAVAIAETDVRLIHEPFDHQQRTQRTYVDPLVFVFWCLDNAGANVLCLLVQFKTVGSRDPDHHELQSLYLGNTVYKFMAQVGDVSLLALICSDAFAFSDALVDQHSTNLLLIHIQLNQKPGYSDYAAYRSRLLSVASNNNVEVLCLNWAAQVLIEGSVTPWNSIAGSAWYIAPRGADPTDADINQLHRDGIYYSLVGDRWHAFYLNYSPHSVLLRKQPVFTAGPQVLAQRISPQLAARREWSRQLGQWVNATADDGFNTFIQPYGPLQTLLPQLCSQDPLAVERALELLEGPDGKVSSWYTLRELRALRVAEEESLRRVTVSQEIDIARRGVAFRRRRARTAQTAATIPGQPVTWPAPVADLAAGFQYRWMQADPHSNVEPLTGGQTAAFVYLGEDPEIDTVANIYARLSKARKIQSFTACLHAGVDWRDSLGLAEDRLCVVYKANHALQFYRPSGYASIATADGHPFDDIAGEGQ